MVVDGVLGKENPQEYGALLLVHGDASSVTNVIGHLQGGDASLPAIAHWTGGIALCRPKIFATESVQKVIPMSLLHSLDGQPILVPHLRVLAVRHMFSNGTVPV